MQSVQQYFKNYPSVDKFFFTSDGLAFFDKNAAESHAGSLVDKAIKPVTREEAETEEEDDSAAVELATKIKAAQKVVDKAEGVVATKKTVIEKALEVVAAKRTAFENAADNKKAAAETALNTAKVKVTDANTALADAETALTSAKEALALLIPAE